MSVQNGTYTRGNGFTPEKDGIIPRFHIESVTDEMATQREGRLICFDQERVELMIPGNMLNSAVEIVNDGHRNRWPEAYKRFKDGHEMAINGTPLEMWPVLRGPSQIRELKAMNLFTVEHIRDMSDHVVQRMMGGGRLRQLAKAFLDDAEAGAALSEATAKNEAAASRISELENKVSELTVLLNQVHGELVANRNAPNPIESYIPGQHDPMERMRQGVQQQPAGGQSSLENLPSPRNRKERRQQAEPEAAAP